MGNHSNDMEDAVKLLEARGYGVIVTVHTILVRKSRSLIQEDERQAIDYLVNELSFSVIDDKPITEKQQQNKGKKPSERQTAFLRKQGINPDKMTLEQASKTIEALLSDKRGYVHTNNLIVSQAAFNKTINRALCHGAALGFVAGFIVCAAIAVIAHHNQEKRLSAALRQSNAAAWDLGFTTANYSFAGTFTFDRSSNGKDWHTYPVPVYKGELINPYNGIKLSVITVSNMPETTPSGYLSTPIIHQ